MKIKQFLKNVRYQEHMKTPKWNRIKTQQKFLLYF